MDIFFLLMGISAILALFPTAFNAHQIVFVNLAPVDLLLLQMEQPATFVLVPALAVIVMEFVQHVYGLLVRHQIQSEDAICAMMPTV